MQTGDKFKVDYQLARVILMSAQIPLSGRQAGLMVKFICGNISSVNLDPLRLNWKLSTRIS